MYDIPSNDEMVREILSDRDMNHTNDIVVLDLMPLYTLRPTYNNIPTSLGIVVPGDMYDIFNTIFIRVLAEAMLIKGIHVSNATELLESLENEINDELMTVYSFDINEELYNYIARFHSRLRELMSKAIGGYVNIGNPDDLDTILSVNKFYTVDDLNIYIDSDKANMKMKLKIWTRRT